jgi:hypothetical protein
MKSVKKWWAMLGTDEKTVLQFSHEVREFFPELLDTWEPPKEPEPPKLPPKPLNIVRY